MARRKREREEQQIAKAAARDLLRLGAHNAVGAASSTSSDPASGVLLQMLRQGNASAAQMKAVVEAWVAANLNQTAMQLNSPIRDVQGNLQMAFAEFMATLALDPAPFLDMLHEAIQDADRRESLQFLRQNLDQNQDQNLEYGAEMNRAPKFELQWHQPYSRKREAIWTRCKIRSLRRLINMQK